MTSKAGIEAQAKLFEVEQVRLTLNDRFLVPPFSALDARAGYWQQRKKDWISLGIKSELGRDQKLLGYQSLTAEAKQCDTCKGRGINEFGKKCGHCDGTGVKYGKRGAIETTTSVFDPVLCEIMYRWFAPEGGVVLDPFAGGSVRGIVAGALGRGYLGIDLRVEQVESNYDQLGVVAGKHPMPVSPDWVTGDSANLSNICGSHKFDAVFSCPPYFDLEQYSDDPRDLSNMEWAAFVKAYKTIVYQAVSHMNPDSFAVFVVGDIRDKVGNYRGLVPMTVDAFTEAGAGYYNEAVLLTMLGTAPVRVASQFGAGRKLGKVHQNVLVFVKGDAKKAAAKIPVAEVAVESGGAVWRADQTATVPVTGEVADYTEGVEG